MSFKEKGYEVLKGFIQPQEIERLYTYTLSRAHLGNYDDGLVVGSPSFYQDQEVQKLQAQILPKIQEYIGIPLKTVYCYHRVYLKGAILRMHRDGHRNEISVTLNIGQEGPPWDLWLLDYDENAQKIVLNPGDALIYRGSELSHWRGKLEHSDKVSQLMFGFIDKTGKHKWVPSIEILRKIRQKYRRLWGIEY